jgi:hypothetical protein
MAVALKMIVVVGLIGNIRDDPEKLASVGVSTCPEIELVAS